jgi:hypothetical protein
MSWHFAIELSHFSFPIDLSRIPTHLVLLSQPFALGEIFVASLLLVISNVAQTSVVAVVFRSSIFNIVCWTTVFVVAASGSVVITILSKQNKKCFKKVTFFLQENLFF